MRINILAKEIDVVPFGAPRCVYALSVLKFDSEDCASEICGMLRSRGEVVLRGFELAPFKREEPATLLAERPLALVQLSVERWSLTMP